ncbi:MAG: hypothetical protein Q7S02_06470, partial [bacterium]|nr:hypothetical protein [bacterium]
MSKKDKEDEKEARVTPEPVAVRVDFTEFVESLWSTENKKAPQRIELRMARYRKKIVERMTLLTQIPYAAAAKEPTRPEIVELSNRLLNIAQTNCNNLPGPPGQTQLYVVLAYQFGSGDDVIGLWLLNLSKKEGSQGDTVGASGGDEEGGGLGGGEDGAFPDTPLGSTLKFQLEQSRDSLADRRFLMREFREAYEGIMGHMKEENSRLSRMVGDGFNQQIEMM